LGCCTRNLTISDIGGQMNHIEFIEKNVKEELTRQGFAPSVAQGGGVASG